ncbi:porin family protein [Dyella jejuensis]|uniref:Porin family protein n=1 Tax=Dyella jejuensis TaxID=1432009 RepID=A0ABW8JJN7_9GAMM
MRKILFAVAFAAAGLVALPAAAQDTDRSLPGYQPEQAVGSGNWFIDANVGRTSDGNGGFAGDFGSTFGYSHSQRDHKTGYGLVGGYRWKIGQNLGLGLEAGYADLGNFKVQNAFHSHDVDQTDATNALHGWLVGVNGRINLTTDWYLSARGGYFHANDYDHTYTLAQAEDYGSFSTTRPGHDSYYAGIGTGWDINEHWGIGLSYDYYHAGAGKILNTATGSETTDLKRSTSIVSITGEYRF